jgi:hypothetical protein
MDLETTFTVVGNLVGNLAIALSLVVALVFGVVQVRVAAKDRRERATLAATRSFQTRELSAYFARMRVGNLPQTAEAFYALPEEEQVSLIHFAWQMEMLGLLVHDGELDLALVERTLGSFVVDSWGKYRAALLDMRRDSRDPFLGEYFQWLAERVEAFMRERPRKPAYA